MSSQITAFSLGGGLLLLGSLVAIAAEPTPVLSKSPIEISEQQNLEAVLRDLPLQKSKWAAFAHSTLTYVVRQGQDGLLLSDPCESLPIRVKVSHGHLQSAHYNSSGGRCRKGQPAPYKSPTGEHRYFTPEDLFARIAKAKEQLDCYQQSEPRECVPTSLYVTYDPRLGLPIKMEDYSEGFSDY